MGKLSFCTNDTPHGTVVKIAGEISVEEADELERLLQALSGSKGGSAFVLDLSDLTFAASLAIGCLLRFRSAVVAAGGRVALAEMQPMVNESLRRAHLHRVFQIYPTVAEALNDMAVT